MKIYARNAFKTVWIYESACGSFNKNKGRRKEFKEIRYLRYTYQNDLDKACFQHHMAYGDFKDLKRITIADKALRDKAFNIAKNLNYDEYQRAFASLFHKSFDKKTLVGTVKSEVICYEELAEELFKPSIIKFEKKDVRSLFMDNIWGADFKGFGFFYAIYIYRNYV